MAWSVSDKLGGVVRVLPIRPTPRTNVAPLERTEAANIALRIPLAGKDEDNLA
jgi:hypothetical protein